MNTIASVVIALLLSFLSIYIVHIVKVKFPKHYFSLGQIIIDQYDDITIIGFLTKMFPPLAICLFVGLFNATNGLEISLLVGFFSSFLVIWPVVLCRNQLLSREAKRRIRLLFLIYFFYICSYLLLSYFGFFIGNLLRGVDISNLSRLLDNWYKTRSEFLQDIIVGLIVTVIIGTIVLIFGKTIVVLFYRLKTKISRDIAAYHDEK